MGIPAFFLSYLMLSIRGCRGGAMNGSLVSGCVQPPLPHFRFHGYSMDIAGAGPLVGPLYLLTQQLCPLHVFGC